MHSFVALGILGLQWAIIGYSLAFAPGNAFIGDLSQFMLMGTTVDSLSGTIPTYVFVMFQGMFAIITPALISGAIAERMKFSTYIVFILLWAFLIYDPLVHWIWGGGWLQKMGVLGFCRWVGGPPLGRDFGACRGDRHTKAQGFSKRDVRAA